MKKNKNKYDLYDDNVALTKSLNEQYFDLYQKIETYVFKHQSQSLKANIILTEVLNQLIKHQNDVNDISKFSHQSIKAYVQQIEKRIKFKDKIKEMKNSDTQRYTISGLWITMCGYIVLMFLKEFLTDHYLIHISIDFLVAVFAFYITIYQFIRQYKIIKRYQLKIQAFSIQLIGVIISIFVVLMTLSSPFDISFLIMVIAFITSQKMIKKGMNK
ncbi:hypothetical protein [uncultured Thomasclavelia sp.]|uniref:hypothetical protein n=1 Tax=uncultured Thomasclavelia sp. TaxID=3025759 RepID=UPI0025D76453|nr:hypothetical protein [uncultured Thomasclavelia sp.]